MEPNQCERSESLVFDKGRSGTLDSLSLERAVSRSSQISESCGVSRATKRGFRSWTSFQNSYELVGIGEENDRRCLHNHMLHQMEAKKSNRFVCDFCRRKIVQGELFWSCERCVWDVCQACYAKGARFKAGSEIELIQPFHHYRRHTSGIIQEVIDDSEGRHQQLLVTLRHEDSPSEERLQREDFSKIRVIEKSQLNVRLVVGVCLIVAFFLYGILDHHRLSRLISRLVHWCRTIGMWSALILFLVSSVLPVIMLPVFPVMALSGPLFTKLNDGEAVTGGAIAFGVVFSGLWVGSVLAFALGKTLLNDYARKASKHSRVLRRLNRIIDGAGVKIVFMARSLPILPAEVFDYACAMTTLAVHEYAIGCLGSAVPVAFWTFSTAQASDLTSPKRSQATHLALIIINVGCLALLTVLLVGVIQKHEQEHAEEDETIQIAWNTGWKDPKTEILQVLRFHQLDPHKEGRDFTIRDCNNKLLQLGGVLSIGSFLIRKWDDTSEVSEELFPLKVHIHKEAPLVNELLEPASTMIKYARDRLGSQSEPLGPTGSTSLRYQRIDTLPEVHPSPSESLQNSRILLPQGHPMRWLLLPWLLLLLPFIVGSSLGPFALLGGAALTLASIACLSFLIAVLIVIVQRRCIHCTRRWRRLWRLRMLQRRPKQIATAFGDSGPCCICLGESDSRDSLIALLPCRHALHAECYASWVSADAYPSSNLICPVCRCGAEAIGKLSSSASEEA
ncbi:membrane protein [Symbiodinium microadriaticum]|uniref:Membrane protein n=1 Tax=Symbiodinium microadriaticum TaxID=2951 RepID=A0A1Q9D5P5_SYMMI|nr:membrane protein [Symbiodinium microadriaticum]